jgi:hypothetical protein
VATYQVDCVNKVTTGNHDHITHLGVRNGSGWQQRLALWEVLAQIRNPYGDRYYTVSPTTGRVAWVVEGGCEVCGQRPYVRTTADGISDNNLSYLRICRI